MSQLAVFITCQIPFRFGLPSARRAGRFACDWPESGTYDVNSPAIETTAATVKATFAKRVRICPPDSRVVNKQTYSLSRRVHAGQSAGLGGEHLQSLSRHARRS